jgi:hypothetical protein
MDGTALENLSMLRGVFASGFVTLVVGCVTVAAARLTCSSNQSIACLRLYPAVRFRSKCKKRCYGEVEDWSLFCRWYLDQDVVLKVDSVQLVQVCSVFATNGSESLQKLNTEMYTSSRAWRVCCH